MYISRVCFVFVFIWRLGCQTSIPALEWVMSAAAAAVLYSLTWIPFTFSFLFLYPCISVFRCAKWELLRSSAVRGKPAAERL